jgi:DNA replication protein DnaC
MNQIETQMRQLRLHGMVKSWTTLQETRKLQELSFSDGMEILLQSEQDERNHRRFQRLEHQARFRYKASLEEVKASQERGVDKNLIASLATGLYMDKGESVLITGATGCGKSFLASALGHQACLLGRKVLYFNVQKLMLRLKMTRVDGSIYKLFDKISKTDLLIIDDFGLTHLDKQQQIDLMEIIEDRHAKSSTIIASQLPVANWYDVIGEDTIADAILDRMVNTSHIIQIKGESLRKKL